MKLSQEQSEFFHREGWLFLPELFAQEEVDFSRARRSASTTLTDPRFGARRAARRARPSPRISTTRLSVCLAGIRA